MKWAGHDAEHAIPKTNTFGPNTTMCFDEHVNSNPCFSAFEFTVANCYSLSVC